MILAGSSCIRILLSDSTRLLFRILFIRTSWDATLYHLAWITWIFIAAYIAYMLTLIDVRISPFNIDLKWWTSRVVGLAIFRSLATLALCSTLLYRVRALFKVSYVGVHFDLSLSAYGALV